MEMDRTTTIDFQLAIAFKTIIENFRIRKQRIRLEGNLPNQHAYNVQGSQPGGRCMIDQAAITRKRI
jgi:hypothetical protein